MPVTVDPEINTLTSGHTVEPTHTPNTFVAMVTDDDSAFQRGFIDLLNCSIAM